MKRPRKPLQLQKQEKSSWSFCFDPLLPVWIGNLGGERYAHTGRIPEQYVKRSHVCHLGRRLRLWRETGKP